MQVFDLDGTAHNEEFGVQLYQNVTAEFVQTYPDFSGAKVIMSGTRYASNFVLNKITISQK